MQAVKPRVSFEVPDVLNGQGLFPVELTFESMWDFTPDAIAHKLELLHKVLSQRTELKWLLDSLEDEELRCRLDDFLATWSDNMDAVVMEGSTPAPDALKHADCSKNQLGSNLLPDLVEVIRRIKASGYCKQWSALLSVPQIYRELEAAIDGIDSKLSSQINLILHHDEFRLLEGTWRGLHYLVQQCESCYDVHVKVLNVSKQDLLRDLERAVEFDHTALFKKVYEEEFGTFGGEPFGCLVGDYYFGRHPQDISMLQQVSHVAASASTAFISGAAPALLTLATWSQLNPSFNLDWFLTARSFSKWTSFCDSIDSDFIFLTLPRLLARRRYGSGGDPTVSFKFEECPCLEESDNLVWFNASYALAAIIARVFQRSHWFAPIDGPYHGSIVDTSEGAQQADPVYTDRLTSWNTLPLAAEFEVHHTLASRLKAIGLCAITKDESSPAIYFQDIRSVRWWRTVRTEGELSPDLPALLCASRFLYHFRCLCREIGPHRYNDPEPVITYLNHWLKQYVQPDPCDTAERIMKPLAEGRIEIPPEATAWNWQGEFRAILALTPAYQFDTPYPSFRHPTRLLRITKGPFLEPAAETTEHPVIVIMADLGVNAPTADKRFISVDIENFNHFLKDCKPCAHMEVANLISGEGSIAVDVRFNSLEDFEPEQVGSQIEPLHQLFVERAHLVDLALYTDVAVGRDRSLGELLKLPGNIPALFSKMEAWINAVEEGADSPIDPDVIKVELQGWLPILDSRFLLDEELWGLLRQNLVTLSRSTFIRPDTTRDSGLASIEAIIGAIDRIISRQLSCIFHHPAFRRLEASWRGLHYLVKRLSGKGAPRAYVLNIGKPELAGLLRQEYSGITSKIEYLLGEGDKLVCFVCDYSFDHTQTNLEILAELTKMAAAQGVPLMASASPKLLKLTSWEHFHDCTQALEALAGAEYTAWHSFYQKEQARNLFLIYPEFQVRPGYRRRDGINSKYEFEEDTPGIEGEQQLWSNSAYVVAAELAQLLTQKELYRDSIDDPFVVTVTVPNTEELLGPVASRFTEHTLEELKRYGLICLALRPIPIVIGPGHRPA
jgi:type VI secretion system protein ImpC